MGFTWVSAWFPLGLAGIVQIKFAKGFPFCTFHCVCNYRDNRLVAAQRRCFFDPSIFGAESEATASFEMQLVKN